VIHGKYAQTSVKSEHPPKNLHMLFTAAQFIIAQIWTQPRYPSVSN
jgi:hypothetical protein